MTEGGSVTRTAGKVAVAAPWNVVTRGLTAVFSIAFSMAVVRGLGDYEYGRYSIVQTALGFFTIFYTFGMTEALLRFVPSVRAGRPGAGRRVIAIALALQVGAWIVLLVLCASAAGLIDDLYTVPVGALLVLGAALGVAGLIFETMCVVYTGLYRTRAVAGATFLARVVSLGLVVVAMLADWGVAGALLALAAGSAAGAIFLLRGFLVELRPGATADVERGYEGYSSGPSDREWSQPGVHESSRPGDYDEVGSRQESVPRSDPAAFGTTEPGMLRAGEIGVGRLLRYVLPLVGRSLLGQIVWRQSEALIVGFFWGAAYAGFFHLGYSFPQRLLEFIPLALWPLVLAGLSEVQSRRVEDLPRAIGLYYRFLFLLVIPVAFFGLTMGDKALVLLYGSEMQQAGTLCRLFFGVFVIAFLGTPLHMATYVVEKTWANLAVGVAGAVITLGLDLVLIPRYGLMGGVLPTALGLVLSNWLQYKIARRYVPGLAVPWSHLARVCLASCPIFVFYFLRPWAGGIVGFLVSCLGMAVVFAAGVRTLRVVGDEERALMEASPWRALRVAARVLSGRA